MVPALGLLLAVNQLQAQTRVVLNGARVVLANKANLVIANPAPNAITRQSGHIISEGEDNQVKWLTGNLPATYTVPFGNNNSEYLPLRFTKSAGAGSGFYLFATYGTGWENSRQLPVGITNLTGPSADNSTMTIDRFWKIEARDYTTKPDLSGLTFTYATSELAAPNTIAETMLAAQRWNDQTQSWGGFAPTGEVATEQKNVSVNSVPANQAYTWWTLVDRSSPLPLELLSFEARKTGSAVKLDWVTAQESNCHNFEIERSADGRNFTPVGSQNAKNGTLNRYLHVDANPLPGTSYYRLKQNDLDGTFTYSAIRTVLREGSYQIMAYPNPTQDRQFQLLLSNAPLGNYQLTISDTKGSQVMSATKQIDQPVYPVKLPANLKAGLYLVTLQSDAFTTQFKLEVK